LESACHVTPECHSCYVSEVKGRKMTEAVKFTNEFCSLRFHRQSLRGVIRDYIISFHHEKADLEFAIAKGYFVFQQLMDSLMNKDVKGRLVAEIEFEKVTDEHAGERVVFHFASYSAETIHDPKDFYQRHMAKIASRLDSFHEHGSNLLLCRIKHIHIQLNVLN